MTQCNAKNQQVVNVNIDDIDYELKLEEKKYDLDLQGSVVNLGTSYYSYPQSIYTILPTYISYNIAEIDVSDIVDEDKFYIPIVTTSVNLDKKEARLTLNSICWFFKSRKIVQIQFTNNAYQQENAIRYSVSLIPTNNIDGLDSVKGITDGLDGLIDNMQTTSNLVTSISGSSTDTQYPSAKCMYDIVGDIESLLAEV